MQKKTLISIIIPIYNVEEYLEKCINTIIEQDADDIECILVDDGSPDRSGEICEEYARRNNRIKVIHKENGGLSSARNAGLDVAQGEYIWFVDGDDYIEPNSLDTIRRHIASKNSDWIVFQNFFVNKDTEKIKESAFESREYLLKNAEERVDFFCNRLILYKVGWEAWRGIYKSSIIKEFNLRFYDNKAIFAEDLYFTICYLSHSNSVYVSDEVIYFYVKRAGSIMDKAEGTKIVENVKLCKVIYDHFQTQGETVLTNQYYALFYRLIDKCTRTVSLAKKLKEFSSISEKEFFIEQIDKFISHYEDCCAFLGKSISREEIIVFQLYKAYATKGLRGWVKRFFWKTRYLFFNVARKCGAKDK